MTWVFALALARSTKAVTAALRCLRTASAMGARGAGSPVSARYAISLDSMLCMEAGTIETPRPAATRLQDRAHLRG